MFKKINTCFRCCLLLALLHCAPYGADAQTMGKETVAALLHALTGGNAYSYKYIIHMIYPNGQKDELSGDVYCDIQKAAFLNKSSSATTLLTDKWYMSLNHDKKDAVIYDVPKLLAQDHKTPEFFRGNFRKMMISSLLDSQLLAHCVIKSCVATGSVVHLQLDFPARSRIKKLVMELDKDRKVIRNIRINAFFPYGNAAMGKPADQTGVSEEIICTDYKTEVPERTFSTDPYFRKSSDSKITLVQYQDYHLKTNL